MIVVWDGKTHHGVALTLTVAESLRFVVVVVVIVRTGGVVVVPVVVVPVVVVPVVVAVVVTGLEDVVRVVVVGSDGTIVGPLAVTLTPASARTWAAITGSQISIGRSRFS